MEKPPKKPRPQPAYPLPPIKKLILERTACYGTCPVYKVEVRDEGAVLWTGERFVKEEGRRLWEISPEQLEQLRKTLEKYDFLNLDIRRRPGDECSCAPSCITTAVFKDGSIKKIDHYHGDESYLPLLTRLENCLDAIIGTRPYVGPRGL